MLTLNQSALVSETFPSMDLAPGASPLYIGATPRERNLQLRVNGYSGARRQVGEEEKSKNGA